MQPGTQLEWQCTASKKLGVPTYKEATSTQGFSAEKRVEYGASDVLCACPVLRYIFAKSSKTSGLSLYVDESSHKPSQALLHNELVIKFAATASPRPHALDMALANGHKTGKA